YEKQPWKMLVDPTAARTRQKSLFRLASDDAVRVLTQARNERFDKLNASWPELPRACLGGVDLVGGPLEAAYTRAAQTALADRLDLMNRRAGLVDGWRQISVRANALLGVLDVGYSLDSPTPAPPAVAQPFNFSTRRTTQRLTFNG